MCKYVIIGAGQTGRGLINRILNNNSERVLFLDKNKELVSQLENKSYKIEFSDTRRGTININNFDIWDIEGEKSVKALSEAEVVFVAIGAENISDLLKLFESALVLRKKDKPLIIMLCENGVNNVLKLAALKKYRNVCITEGIVFCTTLQNGIDIISEDLDWIPYDRNKLNEEINLSGFEPIYDFITLIKRKIYTYNCLSAAIAYLGYYKGYEEYSLAANDVEISDKLNHIKVFLDDLISKEFEVNKSKQQEFSSKAIQKFKNKQITDTILRNTRSVKRKLGHDERIIYPLILGEKHHLYSEELVEVCACAIYYGLSRQEIIHDEIAYLLSPISTSLANDIKKQIDLFIEK